METTPILCMCDSWGCDKEIQLPLAEAQTILQDNRLVVIVTGCPNGPSPTDKLVEKRNGYTLYQED